MRRKIISVFKTKNTVLMPYSKSESFLNNKYSSETSNIKPDTKGKSLKKTRINPRKREGLGGNYEY